ncbi:MAG: D-2-hydroxyacid dehydrogenase family protein [Deinococcota bacterium]
MTKPKLLILDDYEGALAAAPALSKLRDLADVTIMNQPIDVNGDVDLAQYQVMFALRERTEIDAALLAHFPKLELILQSGGHAYHLERTAASAKGIVVALGRGAQNPKVVMPELTWALILGLNRQLYLIHQQMVAGMWPEIIGISLHGKTLGILGYGRHGQAVANIAKTFGMRVIAWDRGKPYPAGEDVFRVPLEKLMATADVVTIHLKLSDESTGLVSRELLTSMKPTALLINTSRGAIVDENALIEVLSAGKIAGAGLDVFATEPLAADSPLRSLSNVILTPHIGWKVDTVLHEWMAIAADQLEAWLNHQLDAKWVMNPEAMDVQRDRIGSLH